MKGKTLFPYLSDEPTMEENVIEGLAKILQLTYLMSIGEVAHPTRNRIEPVPAPTSIDDLHVYCQILFSKHWNEFKSKNPIATQNQFKTVQKYKIQNVLNDILAKIPSFRADNRYSYAEMYINEYLTDHKEAIKPNEAKPEPENGVKAWIICLEQQEKESVPKVIERIKQTYNWKFNYSQLKNGFIPYLKIIVERSYNHFKLEATEKQKSDLILSMSFLKDEKSIKKAENILKNIS